MVKKLLFSTFLFILFLGVTNNNAVASHIPGANITYTCNSANPLTYTFTLTLFRKCPGTHPATMSPTYFTLTNTCGLTNPVVPTWNQVGVAQDVNQLCATATSNCSGGSSPGVWLYTYEATITLPGNCDTWTIAYDLCCRDASSNLTGTSSNSMATSTTMYTATAPCNNSPVVTAAPIPYACTNTNFNYCLTIADPEGDSTYFSMVAPAGAGQAPIAHLAGYSITAPLTGFVLDPLTGCFSFNEPNIGNYVVAIQINSYDNSGNLIASIIHDFQVMVIACTNTPPTNPVGGITNFQGTGTLVNSNTIGVCYGDSVCFDVIFQDLVDLGNNLTIVQNGTTLLPNSTFTQTGTNPVTGTFCWIAQPGFTGNVVTFIANDDGCPVMGTTGFGVNFQIATGVYAGPDPFICGTQSVQLQGYGAGSYTWSPATGLSCTNCPNPIAQPAVTTTYTVTGNLIGSCPNTDQVTVNVVADFPLTLNPTNATICANGAVQLNASGPPASGPYTYSWTPNDSITSDTIGNPIVNPMTSTNYTVTVTAANGCAITGVVPITVSGIGPTVTPTPIDTTICLGDNAQLNTTAFVYPVVCGPSSGCSGTNTFYEIGNGTAASSAYSGFYGSITNTIDYSSKTQYIYTKSELNAMGVFGGTIRSIGMFFTLTNTYRYDNVTIWMGCTNLDEFPSGTFIPTASLTQVFGPVNNYNPADNNWNMFNISDFDWDGQSNIIIQVCSEEDLPGSTAGASSVRYTSTAPYYRCIYDYISGTISCNELAATRTTIRPNMRFEFCQESASSPTYSWSPGGTLNNSTISNPVATPSANTSYLLNVTANGCTGSAIVNVNIDNSNSAIASNDTTVCPGDPGQLTSSLVGTQANVTLPCGTPSAGCTLPASPVTVGTGTTITSAMPFYGSTVVGTDYYSKAQWIYTAAELNAMGYYGGTIQQIALDFRYNYTYTYDNVTIWMGCTSMDEFPTTSYEPVGSLTQVFGPVNNYNPPGIGWGSFNITDFDWDGTSNIIVQFCVQENAAGTSGYDYVSETYTNPLYQTIYSHSTVATCGLATGSRYNYRPNMRFTACDAPYIPITYTWTPAATLSNPNISNPIATPSVPTTYVVAITGGVCTVWDTVFYDICAILPIDLLNFEGYNSGAVNNLYWSTATEVNNDFFTLERSTDGVYYEEIAIIDGAGNSNIMMSYEYADRNPHIGINYYRLRQTDFDDNYAYSDVITIEVTKDGELSIFPNPSTNFITVAFEDGTLLNSVIKVYDVQGKVVLEEVVSEDNLHHKINIGSLTNGLYFMQVNSGDDSYKGSFFKK